MFPLFSDREDKVAFVGRNELAKTYAVQDPRRRNGTGFEEATNGALPPPSPTSRKIIPRVFDTDLLDRGMADTVFSEIKDATYVRGFLGRMLFAGDDGVKKMRVLSGGEKVRVHASPRMMIEGCQCPDHR